MSEQAVADAATTDAGVQHHILIDDLSGKERAAALLLALGKEHGQPIWDELDDAEVTQISKIMAKMGNVKPATIEVLFGEFIAAMGLSGALYGSFENTEQLLSQYLPSERLALIMEEIRGPAGRNMWEKLSNVAIPTLANYLKNEYPQTVAVILSKIAASHAANVLATLPDEFAMEVVQRMLAMEPVQQDILDKIEDTLRAEFISNLSRTRQSNSLELMADIFNNFDRATETRFMGKLEELDRETTDEIKSLMFTFDDLGRLDGSSIQVMLRHVEKGILTLSLKGANEIIRDFFFENMSSRAAEMLRDELEVMGPVRLKEVDDAQNQMVQLAKSLADKGEIVIAGGGDDDQMVY